MDNDTRRQRRLARLRKMRNEKYGEPVPTTPEEIKKAAMTALKTGILKNITDTLSFFNAVVEKAIDNNAGDIVFYKLGEILEEIDRQLAEEDRPFLDFAPFLKDLVSFGILKEDEFNSEDLRINIQECGPILPFIKSFFNNEVSTFLNVYHDYY